MTLFQSLSIVAIALTLLIEIVRLYRGRVNHAVSMLRCGVFTAAAIAIAFPQAVTRVANAFGIQRGADLVSYLSALAFLAFGFFFYARYVRLQAQITELVRHVAIAEAKRGRTFSGGPEPDRVDSVS